MLHGIPQNTMEHVKQIMKQFLIATFALAIDYFSLFLERWLIDA